MNRKDSSKSRRDEYERSPKKTCVERHSNGGVSLGSGGNSPGAQSVGQSGGGANAEPIPASISEANRTLGGSIARLLEQNYVFLNEIKQNMTLLKVQENSVLLSRFRDNIVSILEQMKSMKGVMGQMPSLPARLNVELAEKSLPKGAPGSNAVFPPFMPVPPLGFPMPPTALPPLPFNGFFPMPLPGLIPGAMPVRVPPTNLIPPNNGLPVNLGLSTVGLVNPLAGMMMGNPNGQFNTSNNPGQNLTSTSQPPGKIGSSEAIPSPGQILAAPGLGGMAPGRLPSVSVGDANGMITNPGVGSVGNGIGNAQVNVGVNAQSQNPVGTVEVPGKSEKWGNGGGANSKGNGKEYQSGLVEGIAVGIPPKEANPVVSIGGVPQTGS
ncbi:hypothetical protein BSKO_06941 [Bryopsis sp. KO-2023]|nr:hypothetical protein BSKO_06941 [Bryopsis sp. KO-2023]